MFASDRKIKILLALIFLVYAVARITSNLPALSHPRVILDTTDYLRISRQPVFDIKFWGDNRPFVFSLLLKVAKQDLPLTSALQLGFSIVAWGALAFFSADAMRNIYLKPLFFSIVLALSLVRHLASWDYMMMTESLSISWFVLFLALGIWLTHGWRWEKVLALCAAGFFLAFTRDTNAYLLLMLAGMLTLAILFRWTKPRALILVAAFLLMFFLNNYTSNIGERWVYPLSNVIGSRILPNAGALKYFQSCGLPFTPYLNSLTTTYANGQRRVALFNDPNMNEYIAWLRAHGKNCYMRWLLFNPIRSAGEALNQFQELVAFDKLQTFFARRYNPSLPWFAEIFLYPAKFIVPLWIALTTISLFAIWKRAWRQNPLWGIYILLCLPILPHLFIVWHGDALAVERHALPLGLQLALCFWVIVFLLLDQFASRWQTRKMESYVRR